MPTDGFVGWVMAAVGTIVATLTSAVAALYKAQISDLRQQLSESRESMRATDLDHKGELKRLDVIEHELRIEIEACKQDREQLRINLAKVEAKQELMENRITAVEKSV
jgi:hypothetical protein